MSTTGSNVSPSSVVRLNIGGKKFCTTIDTLTRREPDSMLAAMFSGRHMLSHDLEGDVFIDRNGKHFHRILDWLRDGVVPSMLSELDYTDLIREANYYQLLGLVAEINARKLLDTDLTRRDIIKYIQSGSLRFRGLNLSGLDLSKLNLSNADFSFACMKNVNLEGASLLSCNFEGTDLCFSNLHSVDLTKVNLKGSRLEGANLEKATLKNANLTYANLDGCNLKGANLESADLRYSTLQIVYLTNANLKLSELKGANLEKATLKNANLAHADLGGCNLKGANLQGANVNNADFTRANLEESILVETTHLGQAYFYEANLSGTKFPDFNMGGANLRR